MIYVGMSAFALAIVLLDQLTKYLVSSNMQLYQSIPLIKGVVELYYTRNSGMAWSLFSGSRWIFVGLTVVFLIIIVLLIVKKVVSRPFALFCLAAIVGGGLGNFIDRIVSGEVVDMIRVTFINFPVFNVADCFISCGCILLCIYVVFFDRGEKKDGIQK